MIWYVRHQRGDSHVETIRCVEIKKAGQICHDLREVGANAWVENERGLRLEDWDFRTGLEPG